jgi:hypothetical protein
MRIAGVAHDKDAALDWTKVSLGFYSPQNPELDSILATYALQRITASALNDVRSACAVCTAETPQHNGAADKVRRSDLTSETQDLAQISAVPQDLQGRATNRRRSAAKNVCLGID